MSLPRISLVRRTEDVPKWMPLLTTLGAVVLAFLIGAIIFVLIGHNPFFVYRHFFSEAFGSFGAFSDVLVKASPLILIGLGCSLAFKMKLWNIGAEGQLFMGAFMASLVPLVPLVPLETTPKFVILTLMAFLGMIGGALYGFIPGFLKAFFNINEVIVTLMLNYIVLFWNNYWIFGKWSDAGFPMTKKFPAVAWLPRLSDYASKVKGFSGVTLHAGVLFGLFAALIVHLILYNSKWGYMINLIGDNPRAARYAGANIAKTTILVFMLSGALAGLAGMVEVSGVVHLLQERISVQYGFSGVIVAWLAKLNPWAVIVVSILFGALMVASRAIQPSGISFLFQGIILFLVISSDVFLKYKIQIIRPDNSTNTETEEVTA